MDWHGEVFGCHERAVEDSADLRMLRMPCHEAFDHDFPHVRVKHSAARPIAGGRRRTQTACERATSGHPSFLRSPDNAEFSSRPPRLAVAARQSLDHAKSAELSSVGFQKAWLRVMAW